jgi:hypothetical protein
MMSPKVRALHSVISSGDMLVASCLDHCTAVGDEDQLTTQGGPPSSHGRDPL